MLPHLLSCCFRLDHMVGQYGRVGSSMDLVGSCTERLTCLTDVYRCLHTGSRPRHSAAEVAAVMCSAVCGRPSEDREGARAAYCHGNSVELGYISVTLVEKITSSMTSNSLPPSVSSYCEEILTVLLQDMDLMSQLVHQFQAEDQITSHLAAKSVSTCVVYLLLRSGAVSPVWEQKCVQAFHSSAPGADLDACLWSLTEVLKRLLRGAHQEILVKLLAAFDSSLSVLCSKLLPEERRAAALCLMEFTSSSRWGTTVCLLLDLLEVLTASSLMCGTGVCLRSQRLTHIHSPALLTTVSCSSEYFVKKRVLLLLKRAVLQKAGEDWALGEVPLTGLKLKHFSSDASALSQSVLTAVAADWLQSVGVESASFFGGTRHSRGDEGHKPDCVMLRAVSLLLLKSMDMHIQAAADGAGVDNATEVFEYLHRLWGFLKRNSVQLMEVPHLCCWVTLLFGEQDDDMMEAAKALLSIFLHHRRCSGSDAVAALETACASGCNPHCHFLFLLQSISFDHSILLDFLISTETCFLEYFVRYLKYLRADWQGFTEACGRKASVALQKPFSVSCTGDVLSKTNKVEPVQAEFSSCVQSSCDVAPVEMIRMAAELRLVEYSSSDESDPEDMDCQDEAGTSVWKKSSFSAVNVKQEISGPPVPVRQNQFESHHCTGSLSQSNSTLERRAKDSLLPVPQSEQTSYPNMATLSGQVTCETLVRAVLCLSQLREVVTRLQTKKLFPYNPSSLLKLLAQIQNCSQQYPV